MTRLSYPQRTRAAACAVAASFSLFSLSAARTSAQTPAAPPALPAAPVSPILPTPLGAATQTLTLDQVLGLALNANSSVRLAREKVIKAQQLIYEANAAGLPQVRVDIVDTYSSNKAFNTASGGSNSTGTLPGGGQIPVIIDTGGGNTGAVTGSGGGGTATGAGSPSLSSPGTNTIGGGGTGTTTTTPTNTAPGTGTGTTGDGTTGPTANPGGAAAAPQVRSSRASDSDLPPVMQHYADAVQTPASQTLSSQSSAAGRGVSQPRANDGTGTGTGTEPGNGSFNNGNNGYHNNYSGRISLTQGVDLFRLVPAAQDVERITRDFYQTDLIRVQNETALSVKNQFFNVLRDQAQVAVYEQQVAADTESVRVTQARVTAGAAAQYDLLTAQTTLSNAQQQLSSARNTLKLAEVNLNNLIGLAPATPIALQNPATPPLTQTFDTDRLTQTAFAGRPELHQADNNIIIAKRLIKLAGSSLLPSLSVIGAGNYNGNVSGSTPHGTLSLSAVLGIPLYDGGTTRAKVREAESDLRSQQITRDQLRQNVSVEVLQALSNINDAQTRASAAGVGAAQSEEALRLANVRYQNGIGTILDVVNAQAQRSQAQTNLLNAQYDYQTALAQLTRAIGGR